MLLYIINVITITLQIDYINELDNMNMTSKSTCSCIVALTALLTIVTGI